MQSIQQEVAVHSSGPRRQGWLTAALLCGAITVIAGCQNAQIRPENEKPVTGTVTQILPMWQKQVAWSPDPLDNGNPVRVITGRVYLFAADNPKPVEGDGTLLVEAFDCTNPEHPLLKEKWEFKQETLKRLLSRDFLGWGYSLIMPWGSYRPDFDRVRLNVHFVHDAKTAPVSQPGDIIVMEQSVDMHSSVAKGGLRRPELARFPPDGQAAAMPPMQQNGIIQTAGSYPPAAGPDSTASMKATRFAVPVPAHQPMTIVPAQPVPNQPQPPGSIGTIAPMPQTGYPVQPQQLPPMNAPERVVENPAANVPQPPPQAPLWQPAVPTAPNVEATTTDVGQAPGLVPLPDTANMVQFTPTAPASTSPVHRLTLQGGIQRPAMLP